MRELLRPTVLGLTRPSLVAVGVSCFDVGVRRNGPHSVHETQASRAAHQNAKRSEDGSRLRRRLLFTGGLECSTPVGHSATTDGTRFLSCLNTTGDVVSIMLLHPTARVVKPWNEQKNDDGAVSPSLLAPPVWSALAEEGGLAPAIS